MSFHKRFFHQYINDFTTCHIHKRKRPQIISTGMTYLFFLWRGESQISSASRSHSFIISSGTSFIDSHNRKGRMIISSTAPKNGMKSGTRSSGDKAYHTHSPQASFAYSGVSLRFIAMYMALVFFLMSFVASLNLLTPSPCFL